MRIIRQNLVLTFAYNTAAIPFAAGVLYPVAGALLSPHDRRRRDGGQLPVCGPQRRPALPLHSTRAGRHPSVRRAVANPAATSPAPPRAPAGGDPHRAQGLHLSTPESQETPAGFPTAARPGDTAWFSGPPSCSSRCLRPPAAWLPRDRGDNPPVADPGDSVVARIGARSTPTLRGTSGVTLDRAVVLAGLRVGVLWRPLRVEDRLASGVPPSRDHDVEHGGSEEKQAHPHVDARPEDDGGCLQRVVGVGDRYYRV